MSKARVEKQICYSCESEYRITFKEEEVNHYPVFCPFCASEVDFDRQEDVGAEDE